MSLIRIEHLYKTFVMGDIEVHAVKDISLSIEKGEFVTIMGPSGSGKSSLMNILGCLDRPSSGKYFLEDRDISQLSRDDLATIRNQKIGFVFQSYNLLSRISVIDNVILPLMYSEKTMSRQERIDKARIALERVGLKDRMDFSIKQLSGGQQQRVTIARSMINNPPLLLADEPTGALDTKTSYEVMNILQELNEQIGVTILMVTHNPELAQFSGRIINFRDGIILDDEQVKDKMDAKKILESLKSTPDNKEGGSR